MGIALEQGWVRTNETFHCPARLKVADGYVAEAYPRAMGNISTAQLIIKSSNVGMAQIGVRSEKVKMYETLWSWGFGSASDVELPGVANGILPFPEQWRAALNLDPQWVEAAAFGWLAACWMNKIPSSPHHTYSDRKSVV